MNEIKANTYKIFIHHQDEGACSYYRAILPWKFCREPLAQRNISLKIGTSIDINDEYDCYVFHRVPNPEFLPMIIALKARGAKIVWDLDDDLWNIPEWSPAKKAHGSKETMWLNMGLMLADHITVTTEPLKQVVARHCPMAPQSGGDGSKGTESLIHVLPNLIDTDKYLSFPEKRDHTRTTRILWAGSKTHSGDLKQIINAVRYQYNSRNDHQVEFIFIGYIPPELTEEGHQDNITFIEGCLTAYYPKMLCALKPDIALIPLADHRFNKSKSNIKYLEMVMAGAIPITTDMEPYQEIIDKNKSSFVDHGSKNQWINFITNVIKYPNSYNIDKYQETVMNEYSWQHSPLAMKWVDFFVVVSDYKVNAPSTHQSS